VTGLAHKAPAALLALLLATVWGVALAPPRAEAALTAKAVAVMDATTGQIVESVNGDLSMGPASLAKMMTLYLVYKAVSMGQASWDDEVWVSEKAWRMGGSKMFIREGDKIPLKLMVEGIGVVSGNDACVAVAEHLSGSEDAFVAWMNEEGKRLGLKGTHFATATGLPAPDEYTTADDMARLGRALITDFPDVIQVLSTRTFTHEKITQHNRNGLLWKDLGVDGIKTGHTEESGFHLVATAKRDDERFIVVVMGTESERAREMIAQRYLMSAFRKYVTVTPLHLDEPVAQAVVWKGQENRLDLVPAETGAFTVKRGEEDKVAVTTEVPEITAPVKQGQQVGVAKVSLGDEVVREVPLVAAQDVPQGGFFKRLWHTIVLAFRHLLDVLF
jgi:D-alanyl-D-alanine carboxypeptidase (penicillin-binding protein 5/6)